MTSKARIAGSKPAFRHESPVTRVRDSDETTATVSVPECRLDRSAVASTRTPWSATPTVASTLPRASSHAAQALLFERAPHADKSRSDEARQGAIVGLEARLQPERWLLSTSSRTGQTARRPTSAGMPNGRPGTATGTRAEAIPGRSWRHPRDADQCSAGL